MSENPELNIEIVGHICCLYDPKEKDGLDIDTGRNDLSLARAKEVYRFLTEKGIHKSRMTFRGMGFSRPLTIPEVTEEDRTSNRRVEIVVTKN